MIHDEEKDEETLEVGTAPSLQNVQVGVQQCPGQRLRKGSVHALPQDVTSRQKKESVQDRVPIRNEEGTHDGRRKSGGGRGQTRSTFEKGDGCETACTGTDDTQCVHVLCVLECVI